MLRKALVKYTASNSAALGGTFNVGLVQPPEDWVYGIVQGSGHASAEMEKHKIKEQQRRAKKRQLLSTLQSMVLGYACLESFHRQLGLARFRACPLRRDTHTCPRHVECIASRKGFPLAYADVTARRQASLY